MIYLVLQENIFIKDGLNLSKQHPYKITCEFQKSILKSLSNNNTTRISTQENSSIKEGNEDLYIEDLNEGVEDYQDLAEFLTLWS